VNFEKEMMTLVEQCPGSKGAAIVDPDGIPVVLTPQSSSLEALGTEFASIVAGVDRTARDFDHGRLQQVSVYAEDSAVVITSLAAGYFLVLLLDRSALVGKGRLLSRLTGSRLHSEFV
jgi:predicted regulator of Ras-like GTPase activity (Roadblock/LC7/MglB family)